MYNFAPASPRSRNSTSHDPLPHLSTPNRLSIKSLDKLSSIALKICLNTQPLYFAAFNSVVESQAVLNHVFSVAWQCLIIIPCLIIQGMWSWLSLLRRTGTDHRVPIMKRQFHQPLPLTIRGFRHMNRVKIFSFPFYSQFLVSIILRLVRVNVTVTESQWIQSKLHRCKRAPFWYITAVSRVQNE